ncbi:unnamed protein product [Candida verbasci]|uniref:Mitochondrial fission process protein 1 n=1 Tax=Candida verbasci TaxID=1227364 RepID=A0A9W4TR59_9ASCO|nr:unnamed protein product [Candida verbasci]
MSNNTTIEKIKGSQQEPEKDEGSIRYLGYFNRIKNLVKASNRALAYASEVGESFRPIAHPKLVTFMYGVSWAYIIGDVSYAAWVTNMQSQGKYIPGLKPWDPEPKSNEVAAKTFLSEHSLVDSDWRLTAIKRGVFQSIASMALPAFTIHTAVNYSSKLLKNSTIKPLKMYAPIAIGLGI